MYKQCIIDLHEAYKTMKTDISITKSKKGTEIIVSSKKINKYGIIVAILLTVPMLLLFEWFHGEIETRIPFLNTILHFLIGVFINLFLHKLIFGIFSPKGFRSITYIRLRGGIHTCHCNEPIRMWQYRIACFVPLLLLGIVPLAYGMIGGDYNSMVFGLLMCFASFDEVYILWQLRSFSRDSFISDRSEELNLHVW